MGDATDSSPPAGERREAAHRRALVPDIATNLTLDERSIWRAAHTTAVSYPEADNQRLFALEDDSFWFRHRNDCIVSAIRQFPPRGPIIDVGGGNGYVTRRLLDEGFDAVLLEPGATGSLNAREGRRVPDVICATLESAGFQSSSLSAVGLFDVLEHIEDDRAFTREIARVLRPEGLLYGTVPAHAWLWSGNDDAALHHRRYDRRSLTELLRGAFDIVLFTHFFRALTLPALLLRTIPYRCGLRRREGLLTEEAEHRVGRGPLRFLLERSLAAEARSLAAGARRSFGTSCLFVARRLPRADA